MLSVCEEKEIFKEWDCSLFTLHFYRPHIGDRLFFRWLWRKALKKLGYLGSKQKGVKKGVKPAFDSLTYEYDLAGNRTKMTDPMGNTTTWQYDAAGNRISKTAPDGTQTLYEYDTRGNMTEQTVVMDPADESKNLVTQYEYTPEGKLAQMTGPEGNVTRYEYDIRSRLVKSIDAAGNETAMRYTSGASGCSACGGSADQPAVIEYPTYEKEFEYDARGRKTTERDLAEGYPETVYEYDPSGNLVSKTDKNGQTTYYDYDVLNRLIRVTDPAMAETSYTYDNRDNLVSLTDAEGNTTEFEYDANNRLVKEIRPGGEETSYAYDAAGNLVETIDAKDQKTEYFYDDAGRLAQINYYATSTDTTPVKTVDFSYDASGNLTGYDDGITSASYEYDQAGRKVSATVDFGAFEKTYSYTYLKNGAKKSFTAPNGFTYGYQYNNNRLTGVEIPDTGLITINEYTWNRPASVTLPGGSTRSYEYDPLMRMKQITAKDPANNDILNYQYDYDRMDNITDKITEHGDYGYDYDDIYRLTQADNPEIPELADESFTYDNVGNRLTSQDTSDTWDYNQNNELLGYNDIEYEYDANGNMTKKIAGNEVTTYVYNTEDRLTEVWNGEPGTGSMIAAYYYDPFGRRLWKEVNGTRTYYMYADEGLIAEMNSSGSVTKSYGWQPGSTWGTDPLFMAEDSDMDGSMDYYFYHNDHLGTPRKMTATNGAVVWSAKYSSFGKAEIDGSSTIVNNLRFPGQYNDAETGLHYNWHRYYDPDIGRYLRVDPIDFADGVNFYAYANANSIRKIDPEGLCSKATILNTFNIMYRYILTSPGLPFIFPLHGNNPHQHCVWNCRMTRGVGEKFAKKMSANKEAVDNAMADLRDSLKRDGCWRHLPDNIQKIMQDHANSADQPADYRDNATGRDCGKEIRECEDDDWFFMNDKKCEDCCKGKGIGPNTPEGPGTDRPFGPRR